MDEPSFCWGFLSGIIIAGIAGFVLQRIRLARARTKAAHNKQPIAGQTKQSPLEVVRQARQARIEIIGWVLLIGLAFACALIFLSQAQ
jgi:uncharacterized membrane protein YraQ (UPF0718 family)